MRNGFIAFLVGVLALSTSVLAEDKPIAAAAADGKPILRCWSSADAAMSTRSRKTSWPRESPSARNAAVTIVDDPEKVTTDLNPVYEKADWAKDFDVIIHDECSSNVKDEAIIESAF